MVKMEKAATASMRGSRGLEQPYQVPGGYSCGGEKSTKSLLLSYSDARLTRISKCFKAGLFLYEAVAYSSLKYSIKLAQRD